MVEGMAKRFSTGVGTIAPSIARLGGQDVVDGDLARLVSDAETGRRVALRVEVDDEHTLAELGEGRAEADRGGALADATFLVRDGDDARGCSLARYGCRSRSVWRALRRLALGVAAPSLRRAGEDDEPPEGRSTRPLAADDNERPWLASTGRL